MKPEKNNAAGQHPGPCAAFDRLKQWQVRRYRSAVDENKWFMGEKLKRPTSWEEAEADFLQNDFYGLPRKWREEYCTRRCDHMEGCSLGQTLCAAED